MGQILTNLFLLDSCLVQKMWENIKGQPLFIFSWILVLPNKPGNPFKVQNFPLHCLSSYLSICLPPMSYRASVKFWQEGALSHLHQWLCSLNWEKLLKHVESFSRKRWSTWTQMTASAPSCWPEARKPSQPEPTSRRCRTELSLKTSGSSLWWLFYKFNGAIGRETAIRPIDLVTWLWFPAGWMSSIA